MSDGITDGIRAARDHDEWRTQNAKQIEDNWRDGRVVSGIGAYFLVDEFEPQMEEILRSRLLQFYKENMGKDYVFSKDPAVRFTYRIKIDVEKIEQKEEGHYREPHKVIWEDTEKTCDNCCNPNKKPDHSCRDSHGPACFCNDWKPYSKEKKI